MQDYLLAVSKVIKEIEPQPVLDVVEVLKFARSKGKFMYTFGNGGSSATASHLAGDLAKDCGCKVFCLSDGISLVTAWANDFAYEDIFANEVKHLVSREDVVLAISGSGMSPNILQGIKMAKMRSATTIGLIACGGGMLKDMVDISVIVPTSNMEMAEDAHMVVCHVIKNYLRLRE